MADRRKLQIMGQVLTRLAQELETVSTSPVMKGVLEGPYTNELEMDIDNALNHLKHAVNSFEDAVNTQLAIEEQFGWIATTDFENVVTQESHRSHS